VVRQERTGRDATDLHVRNFIDCVRSRRQPAAGVDEGHRAASACHLGNIAFRTGRKLRWDAAQELILNDPEAGSWIGREARKPWDVIG
jgi:hypothetical protein